MQTPSTPFVAPRSLAKETNQQTPSPSIDTQTKLPYLFVRNVTSPSKPVDSANKPAEEEEAQPKRRRRITLSEATLLEPKGLWMLYDGMQKLPLSRKRGRESEDMSKIMSAYRSWASTLFPRLQPDDVLARVNKFSGKMAINDAMAALRSNCEIPRALLGYVPFEHSTHDAVLSQLHTATKTALDLKYEKNANRAKKPAGPRVGGEDVTYDDQWTGEGEMDFQDDPTGATNVDDTGEGTEEDTAVDFTDLLRSAHAADGNTQEDTTRSQTESITEDRPQSGAQSASLSRISPHSSSKSGKMIVVRTVTPSVTPSKQNTPDTTANSSTANDKDDDEGAVVAEESTDWDKVLEEIAR